MSDSRERAGLSFGNFEPKPKKTKPEEIQVATEIAKEAGFTSRHAEVKEPPAPEPKKIDGRSLRATGRKQQLNLGVTPEFKERFWQMAAKEKIIVGEELITMLMDFYEKNK